LTARSLAVNLSREKSFSFNIGRWAIVVNQKRTPK